jgi:hypothetical protein
MALQTGSLKFETITFGHKFHGTRTEKYCAARPAATVKLQTCPLIKEGVP